MRTAALARLLRGELRGRRLRAMSLFVVVVALASAALVAGLAAQTKAGDRWDDAFEEANGAHVTIDGRDEALAQVALLSEVVERSAPYPRSRVELDLRRGDDSVTTVYARSMAGDDLPAVARPLLRDGRWTAAGAADELVLDRAVGLDEGIDVGDQVAIATPNGLRPFTVVGRAVELIDCFYPSCTPVTVWLDPAGFDRLDVETVSSLFLRLRDPDATDRFIASLNAYPVGTQGWSDTREDAVSIYEIFGSFLGAFGVFVMIAAGVVVAGSMATRVIARRRDIGLLKAIGATPRQVTASIVLAHALAAAVGAVLGWVLGGALAPVTQVDLGEILGSGGASFSIANLFVALAVVETLVVIATVVPAWRAGRVSTTAALAAVPAPGARGKALRRLTTRLGIGPVGTAGVRDAFGRPARSVLTALALLLAVVAVLASVGVERTIDRTFGDPTIVGDPEELRVYPMTGKVDAIESALEAQAGIESWFTETELDMTLDGEPFLGLAVGGDAAAAGFDTREGRMLAEAGEAVAGWGWLERFGVDVGDRITVEAGGDELSLTVVGWYREGEDGGEVLRFAHRDLERLRPETSPQWFSVNVGDDAAAPAVADALTTTLGDDVRVQLRPAVGSDEIDAFRFAFLGVSVLVVLVALANLGSTMLLAVRERVHDLGVLRAVGVTPRQVIRMVAVGGAVLALVGAVLAIPIAIGVSTAVTEVVGAASGIGPGIGTGPGVVGVLVVVVAAVALSAALGAAAARRAARAQIADLVRYE